MELEQGLQTLDADLNKKKSYLTAAKASVGAKKVELTVNVEEQKMAVSQKL